MMMPNKTSTTLIDKTDEAQVEASRELVRRYVAEAQALESSLVTNISAHISMTPQGPMRTILERHLDETRQQVEALDRRLNELGGGAGVLGAITGLAQTIIGQAIVLTKGPIDMIRGRGGEEKLLKNAKDDCAAEALEIATYDALERVARSCGDEQTAKLAVRHREQEERMLSDLREQIGLLSDKVVLEEVRGIATYDVSSTPPGQAAGKVADEVGKRASSARGSAKKAAGKAGKAVKDATSGGFPIENYDDLTAGEVVAKLQDLDADQLQAVAQYEQSNRNRTTVLERVKTLRKDADRELSARTR